MVATDNKSEWRENWPLALASAAGMSLGMLHIYSMGAFIGPIESQFGWGRGEIAAGLTITSFIGAVFSPFVGRLVDRFGSRKIGLPGAIFFLFCSLALSLSGQPIWTWFALWTFVGFGKSFVRPMVWTAAVASRFHSNRGLALAVALCGTSFASTFAPVTAKLLIDMLGWRGAYIGIAVIWAILCLPLIFFFFYDAEDEHKRRLRTSADEVAVTPVLKVGVGVREGILSLTFLRLGLATLLLAAVVIGLAVHLLPILTEAGLDRTTAAVVAGIVGIVSAIGRILVGVMLDRWNGPLIGASCAFFPIIAALLLMTMGGSLAVALIAVACIGIALGAELDVIAYLATRYFGLKNYGAIFGAISSLMIMGTGLGPMLAGVAYDLGGDYRFALMACIPICLVAALLLGTLGRYPDHAPRAVL